MNQFKGMIKWFVLILIIVVLAFVALSIPRAVPKPDKTTVAEKPVAEQKEEEEAEPEAEVVEATKEPFLTRLFVPIKREHPVIYGWVASPNREPVVSAKITVIDVASAKTSGKKRRMDKSVVYSGYTDKIGEYKTDVLPLGQYIVYADYEGYQLAQEKVRIRDRSADVELNIELTKAGFVSGRVIDDKSRPIIDATVTAKEEHVIGSNTYRMSRSANTSETGEYEIWGITAVSCTVSAQAKDYIDAESRVISGDAKGVDFVLRSYGRIEGRVIDKITKKPVNPDDIKIKVWRKTEKDSYSGRSEWDTSLNTEGNFTVRKLEGGEYKIEIESINQGCYKSAKQEGINVISGETTKGVVIELEKGGTIEGVVVDRTTEKPIKGCKISFRREMDRRTYHSSAEKAKTQEDGTFALYALEDGIYVLMANAQEQNYIKSESKEIVISNANTISGIVIKLDQGGTIAGIVIDKITKDPIGNCEVGFQSRNMGFIDYDYDREIKTKANGKFTILGLRDGSYTITAKDEKGGHAQAQSDEVTIKDANSVTDVVIEMDKGGFISGRVVDESNMPLQSVRVSASPGRGSFYSRANECSDYTDKNGKYEIKGLKNTTYTVSIDKSGYCEEEKTGVKMNTANVDFKLIKGGRIEGKVVDRATGQTVGKDIYLNISGDKTERLWFGRHVSLSEDGNFKAEGLKSGKYAINASCWKGKYKETSVSDIIVTAGQTTSGIVIELESMGPSYKINGLVLDGNSRMPVPQAQIYANILDTNRFSFSGSVTTDSNGAFSLEVIAGTEYPAVRRPPSVPNGGRRYSRV